MDLAAKIVNLRSDKGISQDAFAESIGFSKGTIQKIELGQTKSASFTFIDRICKEYKISMKYFGGNSVTLEEAKTIVKIERLNHYLSKLTDADCETFIKLIKTYYKGKLAERKAKEIDAEIEEIENTF